MVGFIADFLLERWSCYKTGLHAVESSKYFLKLVLRDQSKGAVLFPFDQHFLVLQLDLSYFGLSF